MVRPTIESAVRTLYREKVPVRRREWDLGTQLILPYFNDDSPELLLSTGERIIFVPTREDYLVEDWERVDAKPLNEDNSPGGMFRAMFYLYSTGKPVRVMDWSESSYVKVISQYNGEIAICFEEEGVESEVCFVPTKWDYTTELWTIYGGHKYAITD